MNLSKKQRQDLRIKFGGYCAYCGGGPEHILLPEKGWHVDHVVPVIRVSVGMVAPENDKIENLFPSCASCNSFKSVHSIECFRGELVEQVSRARLYSLNFRLAERFGQVVETASPVVFWFEKYRSSKDDQLDKHKG